MAVNWDSGVDELYIGKIQFRMLSTEEQQYQWEVQQDEIKGMKKAIGTQHMELEALNKPLSLIPIQSFLFHHYHQPHFRQLQMKQTNYKKVNTFL